MVNTRSAIMKLRGYMDEMEEGGISMRPVSESNFSPRIASRYTAKKLSARTTNGDDIKI